MSRPHSEHKHHDKEKRELHILQSVAYYMLLPFIYLLSILPFPVLYLFSNFLHLLFFRIIGYRRHVVMQNLRKSFPDKSEAEIEALGSKFYQHLCDSILEMIKLVTISQASLLKRCRLTPEAATLFASFAGEHKSILMVMGHVGNWEWACNSFNIMSQHQLYVVYHPVSNKYFDQFMYRLRTRNGTKLIAMKNTYRVMAANKAALNATVFVGDQTPDPNHAYWTNFLHQDTPVYKGMEVIAKKMNLPVIYTAIKKVKRGYYEMSAEVLSADPLNTKPDELSEKFTRRLEQDIIAQPETWLWSHRRWKHMRPAGMLAALS